MVSLRDDLKEFREHNLEHKEPLLEKVGMYRLRIHISTMGKKRFRNDKSNAILCQIIIVFFQKK